MIDDISNKKATMSSRQPRQKEEFKAQTKDESKDQKTP